MTYAFSLILVSAIANVISSFSVISSLLLRCFYISKNCTHNVVKLTADEIFQALAQASIGAERDLCAG